MVIGIDQGVEDPEPLDDLTVGVGQQWKRDPVGAGVVGEGIDLVVAEREEGNACVDEVVCVLLQLDQLRAAGWSPHGRSVEDEHRCPIPVVRSDVDHLSGVGGGDDIGERRAHGRSGRELSDRILPRSVPGLGRAESAQLVFPQAGLVTACDGPALPVGGHAGTVSFCIHSYTKTGRSPPRPRGGSAARISHGREPTPEEMVEHAPASAESTERQAETVGQDADDGDTPPQYPAPHDGRTGSLSQA
jgi:hypothetical protein